MTALVENMVETIVTWHTRRRTIGELSEIHVVADGLVTGR